jgi:hypothetical protein
MGYGTYRKAYAGDNTRTLVDGEVEAGEQSRRPANAVYQ